MKIIKSYLTKNNCYKAGRKITPKGIVIHSVGCEQPSAVVFTQSWNTPKPNGRQVCVHAFVDGKNIGNVYQTLPWDHRAWGCGSGSKGSYNNSHIHIELCEPKSGGYVGGKLVKYKPDNFKDYFNDIYSTTVDLVVELLNKYPSIKIDDIVSHSEAHKAGYASNHADVEHWWRYHNVDMNKFRSDVKNRLNKDTSNKDKTTVDTPVTHNIKVGDKVSLHRDAVQWDNKPINKNYLHKQYVVKSIADSGRAVLTINDVVMYAVDVKWLVCNKDTNFLVKVTANGLNIRSGPGTNYKINGVIRDKGVYTIVETNGTWGKLKSGAGWISLNYVTRLK